MDGTAAGSAVGSRRGSARGAREGGIWVFYLAWLLLGAGGALAFHAMTGLLQPVTGATHAARGAAVAAFLACASAGLIAGRVATERRRGRSFTFLAAGGIFLVLSPWILPLLGPFAALAWRLGQGAPAVLFLLRLAVSIPAVVVPAACLGAAFVLLSREQGWEGAERRPRALRLAILLSGAALGASNAGFRLLPLGGETAVALAGAALLLAAAFMAEASRRSAGGVEGLAAPGAASSGAGIPPWPALLWGAAVATLLPAWDRVLGLVFGPFPESMSRTSGVFLAGCALGALAVFFRREAPKPGQAAIPVLTMLAGIAAAGSLFLASRLPLIYLSIASLSVTSPLAFTLRSWGLAALPVLPAGLAFGALLPFLENGGAESREAGGEDAAVPGIWIGRILAGAFLATFAAPVWLIPHLGFRSAILAASVVILASSAAMLAFSRSASRLARILGILAVLAVTLFLVLRPLPGNPRLLASGVHRYAREILGAFQNDPASYRMARLRADLAFYREGGEATVAVEQAEARVSPVLAMTVDGAVAGTTSYDLVPQILSAEIPMVMRPGARSVFLAGYGTGVGAGSILVHPVESLEVAEIEPVVAEASRRFEPANRTPRSDPRLKLYFEDPRQVLRSKGAGYYDLILFRATSPEAASSRFQFTAPFYRLAASRLRRGGLFAQSLSLQGLGPADLASVARTARTAFADAVILQTYYHEAILIASAEPIRFDLASMEKAMEPEKVRSDLGRIGLASPDALVVRHRLSGKGLEALLREGRVLGDGSAPLAWSGFRTGAPPVYDESLAILDRTSTGLADRIVPGPGGSVGNDVLLRIGRTAIGIGDAVRAADLAEALIARGDAADGHALLGDAHYLRNEQIPSVEEWHKALEADRGNIGALRSLAGFSLDRGNHAAAEEYLAKALAAGPSDPEVLFGHGRALFYLKRYRESEADLVKAVSIKGDSGMPLALYYLGLIQKEKGNLEGSAELLRRYLAWAYRQGRPTAVEVDVHLALAEVYAGLGLKDLAEEQRKTGEALRKRMEDLARAQEKTMLETLGKP